MKFSRISLSALALALVLGSGATLAHAEEGRTLTPQQQRMSDCSHESKGMKGDERRAFMSSCLKGKAAPAKSGADKSATAKSATASSTTGSSQQNRMKTCNADAKSQELKGDERKAFMSQCLKGKHNAG